MKLQAVEATTLLDVLPYCSSRQLGLQGLACLAASNKHLRDTALEYARGDAANLLLDAVQAASTPATAAASAQLTARCDVVSITPAITWLLGIAPACSAAAAECLLLIPAVPASCAAQLVAAGVRISYAQLLSAASSMAEGVEVWMQAEHELNVKHDIPNAAIMLCSRSMCSMLVSQVGSWGSAAL
jgi:hypothetical protein